MKKKKYTIRKKIHYILDDYISKGFIAQIILLIGVAAIFVLAFGIIVRIYNEEPSLSEGIWQSLIHMIDQGTITGDNDKSDDFLRIMLILTFIGMAFTSTIIGIISSGIQGKMDELRKGHSAIIEKNHVVIMGFNENTYTISHEITEGIGNGKIKDCVVFADNIPKEEMEHAAKDFQWTQQQFFEKNENEKKKYKRTKFLFRSGDLISENTFQMCAVERARAIIINRENDLETVRILLALVSYLKRNNAYIGDERMPSVVALIRDDENLVAAKTAAGILHGKGKVFKQKNEHKVRVLYYKDIVANLFSQACLHPGLPFVLDSLFNRRGASICVEKRDDDKEKKSPFIGKSLSEISSLVSDSIPMGFAKKDDHGQLHVVIAPGENVRYAKNDRLIYLSEHNGISIDDVKRVEPVGKESSQKPGDLRSLRRFLIFGCSDVLPELVKQINEFSTEGSALDIIATPSSLPVEKPVSSLSCTVHTCEDPYRFSKVKAVLEEHSEWFDTKDPRHLTNIVILSNDENDKTETDERVTVLLLNVRNYLREKAISSISVTSEMFLPQDQNLMQNNSGNDFVVASEISNRMMVQIAGDPRKYYVIEDLLKQKTGMICLRRLSDYVDISEPFNFEKIFRAVSERGAEKNETEIALGWFRIREDVRGMVEKDEEDEEGILSDNTPILILNPSREDREQIVEDVAKDGFESYRLIILTSAIRKA